MSRDGAESTATETPSVDVHRELDHLVGGNRLTSILGVGETGVWKVEGGIEFFGRHWRERGIHHDIFLTDTLQDAVGMHHVRLFFDMTEILGLRSLVAQTFLMAVKNDIVFPDTIGNVVFRS